MPGEMNQLKLQNLLMIEMESFFYGLVPKNRFIAPHIKKSFPGILVKGTLIP